MRLYASPLLLSLVAALHTLVPTQAEAASALFSVVRINYNDGVGVGDQTISIEFDTASGYVGTGTVPKFTAPQSVIKNTSRYAYCTSGTCRSGTLKSLLHSLRHCPTSPDSAGRVGRHRA